MTIRSRLLLLLLPLLMAFLLMISAFFYFNWSSEILSSFPSRLLAISAAAIILLSVILIVFLVADHMSQMVRKLNQAALEIAAGNYETDIQVEGPKEIIELAHTLRTMSECLVEQMSRLRETSLIRERMYGEYECSLLLQYYMLEKVIEEFHHSHVRLRLISLPLFIPQKRVITQDRSSLSQRFEFHISGKRRRRISGNVSTQSMDSSSQSKLKKSCLCGMLPIESLHHFAL